MLKKLLSAAKLDVCDLSYVNSSEPLSRSYHGSLHLHYGSKKWKFNYKIIRFIAFWRNLLITLFKSKSRSWDVTPGSVVFFGWTQNQIAALEPVYIRLRESGIPVSMFRYDHHARYLAWLRLRAYLWAIPFLPCLLFRMLRSRGYVWESFRSSFDIYWFNYGVYIVIRGWLKRVRPAAVVLSNDHINWPRAVMIAAREEGIPSFYIPHAAVTENFPPLRFDYALIDGRDMLLKYIKAGPAQTKIFLTGVPKFDRFIDSVNQRSQIRSVGICLNQQTPFTQSVELTEHLAQRFPDIRFCLRPHPRARSAQIEECRAMTQRLDINFSNPKEQPSFTFLQHMDAVIAGDSSVLLEAGLMNVVPLYYDFDQSKTDWYGFCKSGLTVSCDTPQSLANYLRQLKDHRPDARQKTRFYCANVNTPYDGRASQLAGDVILQVVNQDRVDLQHWERIEDQPTVQAYQPLDAR